MGSSIEYVELLAKSNFSFLTGASHPEELVETAIQKGLKGLALCDFNGVYGLGRGYRIAKHHPSFRFLIGSEVKLSDHSPLVILAKNRKGYGQLCQLLTRAHQGQSKGEVNLSWSDFVATSASHCANWIVLPRVQAQVRWGDLRELFDGQVYVPIARYLDGHDRKRTLEAQQVSQTYNLPLVAVNDVYYHTKQRKILQDVLVSVREGKPLSQVGFDLFSNGERMIKDPQQMARLFADSPQALRATVEIAEQCQFSPKELRYRYPSEWIPQGHSALSYLEELVWHKAPERYQGLIPEAVTRQLRHELKLIGELEYADYFLTIFDIVEFARSRNILCQGRGSAANSAVCFVLGITAIDPVQMNLLFERFISSERNEPPDIDVDFEHERREEVIQYIYQKYGRHRAAMVSAVVTYQWRSAFREVSKAFGVEVGTLSAKKVERDFDQLISHIPHEKRLMFKERILTLAKELTGFPRHLSIHSGGFTLSADPITEIVPVEPARMEGRTIIQWDKYDLDELGLLKIDILSLGMLSALRKTLDMVGKQLYQIPHDDLPTYQMIQRCETVGTFQIESRAQMSMLGRLQPRNFYDLVIEVAIVRPGPIVGKMVHPYLKRRRGIEKVDFPNEKVRAILGRTLGVPLFQEQVMKLAIELAHFTPGEADQLRRSINAWRSSGPIEVMAKRLMQGLLDSGLPQAFADQIFEQIQGFSMYGFPESHAASFALLAYASCYLKCHHPAEFAVALINSQPMGFYRTDTILYEALRNSVRVRPVCVQRSVWDCVVEEPNVIRLGFRVVKGVAQKDVGALLDERSQKQFLDLLDFLKRTHLRKDVVHRLAMAGRLSSEHMDARQALWSILEYENMGFTDGEEEQMSLFDQFCTKNQKDNSSFQKLSDFQKVQQDYRAFSLSTHGHPMKQVRRQVPGLPQLNSQQLRRHQHGDSVAVSGLVLVRQKPPTAKGVVFSTLEDELGFIDLILHPKVYQEYKDTFLNHCFLIVEGQFQKDGSTCSVLVRKVRPIWSEAHGGLAPLFVEPSTYFYS